MTLSERGELNLPHPYAPQLSAHHHHHHHPLHPRSVHYWSKSLDLLEHSTALSLTRSLSLLQPVALPRFIILHLQAADVFSPHTYIPFLFFPLLFYCLFTIMTSTKDASGPGKAPQQQDQVGN